MVVHWLLLIWLDRFILREGPSSDKQGDMKELYDMVNTVNFHTRESSVSRVKPGFEPFPKLTSRELNMSIKNFKEDVQENIDNVLVRLDDGSLDPNAFCRCMFRCWLDGSYDGFEVYQENVSELRRIVSGGKTPRMARQLRSWVGHQFTAYVAREVGWSYSTAQRYIVHGASAEDLAELTGELIDDSLDLICLDGWDDVSDQLRSDIIDAYNERYTSSPVVVGVQGVEELRADIIDAYKVNG